MIPWPRRERFAQHRPRPRSPTAPRDSISQRAPRPRRRCAGKMAALVSPLATARCLLRALGCRARLLPPHRGQCCHRGSPGLASPGRATGRRGTAQEGHRGAVAWAGACLPSPSCRGSVPGGGEVGGGAGAGRGTWQPPGHAQAPPPCHDLPVSWYSPAWACPRPSAGGDAPARMAPGVSAGPRGEPRRGPVASRVGDALSPWEIGPRRAAWLKPCGCTGRSASALVAASALAGLWCVSGTVLPQGPSGV